MRVFVYFNLHKKLWSVKALEGADKGRVIAHKRMLTLANATPRVSEKGRQRVLQERRKNVHAGIVGDWDVVGEDINLPADRKYLGRLYYNPYYVKAFQLENKDWDGSQYAVFDSSDRGLYVYDDWFSHAAYAYEDLV